MKRLVLIAALLFVGMAAWRVADRLSADALGMGVGVLFGIMAGVPTALMLLAAGRRREEPSERHREQAQGRLTQQGYAGYAQQPPVIVLAAHPGAGQWPAQPGYAQPNYPTYSGAQPGYGGAPLARPALPPPHEQAEERQFRVVGEKDEWVDEY